MQSNLIIPLDSDLASLSLVGGKGANLARLARAGLAVPGGFLVTTAAYTAYVAANNMAEWIAQTASAANSADLASLEAASQAIRARFTVDTLTPKLAEALKAAYAGLGRPAVAVRSSATAEDLPDLSFAGQQDTFLNVVGQEALLQAVVACWGSLWTARAIGYRARNNIARNNIAQQGLALGVVIQEMVQSEAAGVLFTANPLSGLRTEMVIDATLGLGEALVAGLVEPDQYTIDTTGRQIIRKTMGAKALAIRGQASGGTVRVTEQAATRQALPDEAILTLAELGQRVLKLYGTPQDIEWAWAGGQLFLLQSRAITSLYPVPEGLPANPLHILLSFGAVQGMLDPMTPLGRDVMRGIVAQIGPLFRMRITRETQRALFEAGERLFINVTTLAQNQVGRRLLQGALSFVEPGGGQSLRAILNDPHWGQPGRPRLRTLAQLARFFFPILRRVFSYWRNPAAGRALIQQVDQAATEECRARSVAAKTLAECIALIEFGEKQLEQSVIPYFLPGVISGVAMFQLLNIAARGVPDGAQMAAKATRGLPHNVTTEMDLALWATAQAIRADAGSAALFAQAKAGKLASEWQAGRLPPAAQNALDSFMQHYGMRGLAEIDLGRARWREEPTHVFKIMQSYLNITDPAQAPDALFAQGALAAQAEIERLVAAVRQTRGGWLKTKLARFAASRMRALMGLRESPKFFAIRTMGTIRQTLLKSGQELAARGTLAQPDDLFFLYISELKALAAKEQRDWQALVTVRRHTYEQEARRKQVPRLLLSDGRAFFAGLGADSGSAEFSGSPVSPGIVEGTVHIVLDPREAQLAPGEILVCPGTDPAWTPLFLAAGGLVMEVGGMMTHGAVVAREYGIPAVVGVHQATTHLRTGQRIRLDGSTGQIELVP